MNDNDIEINLDNENENIDVDREDSIYTNISEEEMNEIKSRIQANENDIVILKAESGNKVLLSIDSNYVMTLQLLNKNNEVLSTGTIDLPIESMIVNASYSNGILTLTLQNGQTLNVDISDIVSGLVSETTFNNAIGQLQGSITALQGRMTQAETAIQGKVDKVAGKGLSTEDYTTAEKNKLANLENYDDTEVKADIQENADDIEALTNKHNTEVAELQSQIEDLQEKVDMAEDLIPTDSPEISDNITLSDSARYYFKKFEVGGKSEQETFTGKNLLEATAESYTLPANSTNYQKVSAAKIYLEAGTKYYISYNINNASTSNTRSTPRLYLNQQYTQSTMVNNNLTVGRKVWEFTPTESGNYDVQYWLQGSNVDVTVSEFMISTSSDTTYEKYVGGQPAPNPDYECPIKNVGDNINIFDKSSTPIYKDQVATEEIENGVRVITQNTGTYHITLYLLGTVANLKGKDITVSANIVPSSSNLGGLGIILCDADGSNRTAIAQKNSITGKQSLTAKIDESYDDNKVIALRLYSNLDSAAKGDYVDYEELKVEEGSKVTGYSAYNCGSVEVKVENGNLFDVGIDNSDYVTNSDTLPDYLTVNDKQLALVIQANGSTCVYRKQNFQGNKDYSFKAISSKASGRIYIRIRSLDNTRWLTDSDLNIAGFTYNMYYKGWFLQVASTNMIKAFSIPECLYWQFGLGFSSADVGTTQIISNIQLVEGTYTAETMPDYVPHEEQTAIFPLEEGQILHEGDTIEDKIVQKRKTVVLNGTETINKETNSSAPLGFFFRLYLPLKAKYIDTTSAKDTMISSHFKVVDNNVRQWGSGCLTLSSTGLYIVFAITSAEDTVEKVQSWLAENLPELEYELAEPIETEFTEAQRTAKAQIDKLISYKGTTHITSEADLDVTYRKDLETMFDKMEELDARLSLLES